MDDLETAAVKFKEWQGGRRHARYPKFFWDELQKLSNQYSIIRIAEAFGINASYLRLKLIKNKPLTFIPIKVSNSLTTSIEFIAHNSQQMVIRFQADHEQLINIILSLTSGKQ